MKRLAKLIVVSVGYRFQGKHEVRTQARRFLIECWIAGSRDAEMIETESHYRVIAYVSKETVEFCLECAAIGAAGNCCVHHENQSALLEVSQSKIRPLVELRHQKLLVPLKVLHLRE